jgi:hypothetical protein
VAKDAKDALEAQLRLSKQLLYVPECFKCKYALINGSHWICDLGSSFNYDFSKEPEGFLDLDNHKVRVKVRGYMALEIKNNNGTYIKALPKYFREKTWAEVIYENRFAYNLLLTVIGVSIGYYVEMWNKQPWKDPRVPD